jgi:methionine-rich copper-binding protein CopC
VLETRSLLVRSAVALSAVVITVVLAPQVVSAHAELDYTVPTDGASVAEPVGEITVAFDEAVTPVGNGFEVLDPQENVIEPVVVTDDDTVFRLQFDPPLAGGAVGVRYEVTSDDGHVVSGSFSFTVPAAPLPAEPPAATPAATQPSPTPAPVTVPPTTETLAGGVPPSVTSAPIDTVTASTTPLVPAPATGGGSGTGVAIAIAVAVVVAAGAFLVLRSRTSGGP